MDPRRRQQPLGMRVSDDGLTLKKSAFQNLFTAVYFMHVNVACLRFMFHFEFSIPKFVIGYALNQALLEEVKMLKSNLNFLIASE